MKNKQINTVTTLLFFYPGGSILLYMRKEMFSMLRCSMLCARVDDPSKIIKKIWENAYKLELPNEYYNNILPTFNVKDLRFYHGEDSRTNSFS